MGLTARHSFTAVLLVVAGCSQADLYTQTGADPTAIDRVAVSGTLCTENTSGTTFPVKVLFMVDSTLEMFAADANSNRFNGPPGSMGSILNRYRYQPHVHFGFVSVGAISKALPAPDGQQFFLPQDPEVAQALVGMQAPQNPPLDVVNALTQAENFILADIDRSTPGAVLRSRYLISMLFAGPPSATPTALADQVQQMEKLIYSRGVLQVRLNVGLLYYGPRTIDQGASDNYNCYPPGTASDPTCNCDSSVHGSAAYCSVYCDVQSGAINEARNDTARLAYEAMAFAGGGQFREFRCPGDIDMGAGIADAGVELVKKDIVAFNRNVHLVNGVEYADSDGDGLTDVEEEQATPATDPTNWDTDGDGLSDMVEFRMVPQQDPTNPNDRPAACTDPAVSGGMPDRDIDLLNDCEEGLLQTSPTIPDTDGDGLPDSLEFWSGTVPTSADDALLDFDDDGVTNAEEVREHTDPRSDDGPARGTEAYRNRITSLGMQPVVSMEDTTALQGVAFRSGSPNIASGEAYMHWDPTNQTLAWSDARYPTYAPKPVHITGSGTYTLTAEFWAMAPDPTTGQNTNQLIDRVSIQVDVTLPLMPSVDTVVHPLISVSERNCYDVNISNIKLMPTLAANGSDTPGINNILVFFTQAPVDRLSSPGITSIADKKVQFVCTDPKRLSTCRRTPNQPIITLTDHDFVSAMP